MPTWKLNIPLDASGGKTGVSKEIYPIPAGYALAPWFVPQPDGSVVMSAPEDGAHTSGSKYARTEYREMTDDGKRAAWLPEKGRHKLSVRTVVAAAPGKIVIGQIHGPDDELVRLYFDAGRIYYVNDKADIGGGKFGERAFPLADAKGQKATAKLGDRLYYVIEVRGAVLTIKLTNETTGVTYQAAPAPLSAFWKSGRPCYFKVGIYLGTRAARGIGSVTVSRAVVTHEAV